MDKSAKSGYIKIAEHGMKIRNRLKRIADMLEKIGVASLAIGVFQDKELGLYIAAGCLILSFIFTLEDK